MTPRCILRRSLALLGLAVSLCTAALAGEFRAAVTGPDGDALADAVVVLDSLLERGSPPAATATIDQVNKQFVPFVTPVRVGTTISFPNNDRVRHHVYSFSPAKTFELPLYSGTSGVEVLFDQPGVVPLGCNIHDWMLAYVYVTESDWFATTDAGGVAVIDVPAGTYRAHVWHPRLTGTRESTEQEVVITDTAVAAAAWQLPLKRPIRARRLSAAQ